MLALVVALTGLRASAFQIPNRWNPWAPLEINDRPNWLTGYKLRRLDHDAAQCQAVLAQAQMRYEPLADRQTGEGCGFSNAVMIRETSATVAPAFALSCRSAVALAMWERHVMQPAAQAHFGQAVRRIEHFGSYSCRNVYGRPDARRSRHATADALDIAGFVLSDGRRIRVLGNWPASAQSADESGRFLLEVHGGGCRFFSTVLGPEYNAAHRDHLHLDRGGFGICR